MKAASKHTLVLGIFPNTRGFAFALFEGPLAPVDWGIVRIREKQKNRRCIERISQLFGRSSPDILLLQDMDEPRAHRAARVRDLNEAISVLAETQGIHTLAYSRARVRRCLDAQGFRIRHQMAEAIGKHIPMLKRFVPPQRKLWMAEDPRMALFEAVGLVLTFYQSQAFPEQPGENPSAATPSMG